MVVVHSKLSFVTCFGAINILPGMNNVSDADMAILNKNRNFKKAISEPNPKIYIGGAYSTETSNAVEKTNIKEKAAQLVKEIQSLSVEEAKSVISQTTDMYTLRILQKVESRKGLQDSIANRITAITSQEGADLQPETTNYSDGSDFAGALTGSQNDLVGGAVHTSMPGLSKVAK